MDSKLPWFLVILALALGLGSHFQAREELQVAKAQLASKTEQAAALERALAAHRHRAAELDDALERALANERSLNETQDRVARLEQNLRQREQGQQRWRSQLSDLTRTTEAEAFGKVRFDGNTEDLLEQIQGRMLQTRHVRHEEALEDRIDELEGELSRNREQAQMLQSSDALYQEPLEGRIDELESQLQGLNREHLWHECNIDRPERGYRPAIPPSMVHPVPTPGFSARNVQHMTASEWIQDYYQHQVGRFRNTRPRRP